MTPDYHHKRGTGQSPVWLPDSHTLKVWETLQPGTTVTVVKRSAKYNGEDRVSYPGMVIDSTLPPPWKVVAAQWTMGTIRQAHLVLETNDVLHEIFSPRHPYNAFAIYRPDGGLKGWYANVTYPTLIEDSRDGPKVIWHDLFIDIVATPDGRLAVLDEDELIESGIPAARPDIAEGIYAARDHLIHGFQHRHPPFHGSNMR